jgi:hypothetical protein
LFDETGIVFLVGAGSGKSDVEGIAPGKEGTIDKLRAGIAVDAPKGEGEVISDVREGFHNPFLGFIEEGSEFCPAGSDIGGVQGEVGLKSANSPASRVPQW